MKKKGGLQFHLLAKNLSRCRWDYGFNFARFSFVLVLRGWDRCTRVGVVMLVMLVTRCSRMAAAVPHTPRSTRASARNKNRTAICNQKKVNHSIRDITGAAKGG
jgi:hypothetical protein